MGVSKPQALPIIALARDSVLLPGITLRIPVSNRTDIPAFLSSIYARSATPKPDATAIAIGCVPLKSPLLGDDGQQLLDDRDVESGRLQASFDVNPGKASKDDLFNYGTMARISGVTGRRPGELALVVEGVKRFRINSITQERPFLEADVTYHNEDGKHETVPPHRPCTADTSVRCRPSRHRGPEAFCSTQAIVTRAPCACPNIIVASAVYDQPITNTGSTLRALHRKEGPPRCWYTGRFYGKHCGSNIRGKVANTGRSGRKDPIRESYRVALTTGPRHQDQG